MQRFKGLEIFFFFFFGKIHRNRLGVLKTFNEDKENAGLRDAGWGQSRALLIYTTMYFFFLSIEVSRFLPDKL